MTCFFYPCLPSFDPLGLDGENTFGGFVARAVRRIRVGCTCGGAAAGAGAAAAAAKERGRDASSERDSVRAGSGVNTVPGDMRLSDKWRIRASRCSFSFL